MQQPTNVTPARRGKRAVAGYFDPAVARELKRFAAETDTTTQELLRQALNDFFRKNGLRAVA
jgi:hypothetical protein